MRWSNFPNSNIVLPKSYQVFPKSHKVTNQPNLWTFGLVNFNRQNAYHYILNYGQLLYRAMKEKK